MYFFFSREICNLQEKEDEEKEAIIAKKNYEDHFIEISACYVEYLEDDHLFNQMFNSDKGEIIQKKIFNLIFKLKKATQKLLKLNFYY